MYVETFQEFVQRRGCQPLQLRNRWLFPDGAQSNGSDHLDPPADPDQRAKLQHEFASSKLEMLTARYSHIRTTIAEQARWHATGHGPSPDAAFPGWRDQLEAMAAEIEDLQRQV